MDRKDCNGDYNDHKVYWDCKNGMVPRFLKKRTPHVFTVGLLMRAVNYLLF